MKAVQLAEYGDNVVARDIPQPEVDEGKVLVQVHAAGVNPFDWKVKLGYMKDMMPLQLPITLGGDIAGVVTAVGTGVASLKEGDEVFGQGGIFGGATGAFAEFDLVKPDSLAHKPTKLSFAEAGAVPLTGVSAIQALYDHLELTSGQKILIHGGAGGIGTIAIQIAKHIGAYVATTVSTNDLEYVKSLGVDEAIDYKNQKFEEVVKDFDAVFDLVGGETNQKSYQVLKSGGKLVSMVQPVDEALAKQFGVTALTQGTKVTTERLTKLAELLDAGVVTVHIEKVFPLEQTGEALSYLQQTPPKGKVVVEVLA
jgi:alcohol dehydrogenase